MKRNTQASGIKTRKSRGETLPLLRGMFIFPESLKRHGNISGSDVSGDEFILLDTFHHSGRESIQGQKDANLTVSEEGLHLSIS